jgi:hypothetical protein
MKQISLIVIVVLSCLCVNAQYKKASFLNKNGRTYDIGGGLHLITKANATVPSFIYSYGKDSEKRIFHWFDLELLFPTSFSYETRDTETKVPITISGKSTLGFIYRYNLAYYVLDNNKEENKLLPFVNAGLNIVVAGADVSPAKLLVSPDTYQYYEAEKAPKSQGISLGANLGAGAIYSFKKNVGLKLTAGYNYQYNKSRVDDFNNTDDFFFYDSHPYVTLGIRFRMERD